jgi:sulfur-carrier protein
MSESAHGTGTPSPAPVVTVKVPAAFHALTGGRRLFSVEGDSIREVLVRLDRAAPWLLDKIVDGDQRVKRYVNVYLNDDDIRGLDGLETKVGRDDLVWIIPAVAGGSGEPGGRGSR